MHTPLDAVVAIDHASRLFLAAKHPNSFVSLDIAEHLVTRHEDDYAAAMIAAWVSRYFPPIVADLPQVEAPMACLRWKPEADCSGWKPAAVSDA